jgi:hypothetical protein
LAAKVVQVLMSLILTSVNACWFAMPLPALLGDMEMLSALLSRMMVS